MISGPQALEYYVVNRPCRSRVRNASKLADVYGAGSSPGVVEGIARVVVTDIGGILAHAVIVGREAGIPAVAGTTEATKKIKTGDRIRGDGNMNAVYILKRSQERVYGA